MKKDADLFVKGVVVLESCQALYESKMVTFHRVKSRVSNIDNVPQVGMESVNVHTSGSLVSTIMMVRTDFYRHYIKYEFCCHF